MDYQRLYDNLVATYQSQTKDSVRAIHGYSERHHVVPRCLGGLDAAENLVDLPARVHFVLHRLLVKIHPHNRSLWWALHNMVAGKNQQGTERHYRITSRTYATLKSNLAALGRSEETKAKISEALMGRKLGPFSETHRSKISAAMKGKRKVISPEHRAAIAASNTGKKRSAETRALMSIRIKEAKARARIAAQGTAHV